MEAGTDDRVHCPDDGEVGIDARASWRTNPSECLKRMHSGFLGFVSSLTYEGRLLPWGFATMGS